MFFQIFAYLTEAVIVYMYIRHIYEPKKNKLISFITILVYFSEVQRSEEHTSELQSLA